MKGVDIGCVFVKSARLRQLRLPQNNDENIKVCHACQSTMMFATGARTSLGTRGLKELRAHLEGLRRPPAFTVAVL